MTPQPSPLTPLGFTREYQAYRAGNAATPFPDSRLLAAARFWSRHTEILASESYASFWLEDLPPLLTTARIRDFEDLHPDELAEIARFLGLVDTAKFEASLTESSLWDLAARKWFYVGEADRALDCLSRAGVGWAPPTKPGEGHKAIPHSEFHTPNSKQLTGILIDQLDDDNAPLRDWLTRFNADWRAIRETGHANQATCVLVERDAGGRPVRGRLRTLEAHIETLPKDRNSDEIVFGHQLCAADDPQVQGAYAALASLHSVIDRRTRGGDGTNADFGLRNAESRGNVESAGPVSFNPHSAFRNPQSHMRAHFTFANGGREPYGGDSLAFACFIAAYGDWWSKDLHRERRLVSSGVALSGALDDGGTAAPVSEASIAAKIERVFFSPLAALVVPRQNRDAAESEAARLHALHPRRRLRILTADSAADLIADGNITIPERVCLGEYAVRVAAKYSRSVKVQAPLLMILGYLLLCLLYPKAWVGFDWNPSDVKFEGTGIRVLNAKGQSLWTWVFPCPSVDSLSRWVLDNLDDDRERELAFLLNTPQSSPCSVNAALYVIDHDGREISHQSAVILGEYPGDTSANIPYTAASLTVLDFGSKKRIMTAVTDSYPARGHIRFWTSEGEPTGWYVSAGFPADIDHQYILLNDGESICVGGYNNRMGGSASLFVLAVDSAFGCSPPYVDSLYNLSWVRRGSQSVYVLFPRTDFSVASGQPYSTPKRLRSDPNGSITFSVDEGGRSGHTEIWYTLDPGFHVYQVRADDYFWPRRDELVDAGVLPAVDRTAYLDSLAARVQYWTDLGWVRNSDTPSP